jgi:serine/threonine-protein kinase
MAEPDDTQSPGDDAAFARLAQEFEVLRALPEAAREQRLCEVTAQDPERAAALRRLFRFHSDDADELATPTAAFAPELLAEALAEAPGATPTTAGPWRLVERIGRGGMGEVWLGERDGADFRQQVAVKLLRHDFEAPQLVRRFRTERRILAGLQHPNIAALLDGGTTDDGRPFVVMELVRGRDLATFCKQERLPLRARLELFQKVCAAVDVAHRSLVVHRDLKPGNVLVTQEGEPKLLDFGIAKLLASDNDAETGVTMPALTGAATLLLTPEYASPEQVRGEPITTATDVYALGAILYELLTGARAQQPQSRSLSALTEAVCEREPVPPSVAVAAMPVGELPACGLPLPRLTRALRGDLDTIVAQAMRKDPARRYPSAAALAADLDRHLRGLPVQARADTLAYRARKFVRRNRVPVVAALLVAVLAVLFVVQIARSNTRLEQANQRITQERDAAERQRAAAQAISDFLVDLYDLTHPDPERARELRAYELLARGRARLDSELRDAPEQRTPLRLAIGRAFLAMGLFDDAAPLLEQAHEELTGADVDPVARAKALRALGNLRGAQDRSADGERLLRESIATWPDDDDNRPYRVATRLVLVQALHADGRLDDAGAELDLAFAELAAQPDADPRQHAYLLTERGALQRDRGDAKAAMAPLDEALVLLRSHYGDDHPALAHTLREKSRAHKDLGELPAARALLARVLELDVRTGGPDNLDAQTDRFQLAMLLHDEGDYDGAVEQLQTVLAQDRKRLGDEHSAIGLDLSQIGNSLASKGDFAAAEPYLRDGLAMQRRTLPQDHPELATTLGNMAAHFSVAGRSDEAEQFAREALQIRERVFPAEHPVLLSSRHQVATLRFGGGDLDGAEQQFQQVYEALRRTLGDHRQTATSLFALATVAMRRGDADTADERLRECLRIYRDTLPPDHPDLARPLYARGMLAMQRGDAAAAEPLLRQAWELRRDGLAPTHRDRLGCQRNYARCLRALGRGAEAAELLAAMLATLRENGADGPGVAGVVDELVALYTALGEPAQAAAVRAGR